MVSAPGTWVKCPELRAGREDSSQEGFQEEVAQTADGIERCVKGKELFWGTGRTAPRTWRGACVRRGWFLLQTPLDLCWGRTAPSPGSSHGKLFLPLSLMWRPHPETALLPTPQELLSFQAVPATGHRIEQWRCARVCTCGCAPMRVCAHMCLCAHAKCVRVHVHFYRCMCAHVCMHVCACAYVRVCTCVCSVFACMYVCSVREVCVQ